MAKNTDSVDSAVEQAEKEASTSRKRSPKEKVFICVAGNKSTVVEAIVASNLDEAKEIFSEMHEAKITHTLDGQGVGYYVAKGTGASDAEKMSVTVTAEQCVRRTSDSFRAEFEDWVVFANGLRACEVDGVQYEDNELMALQFHEPVNPDQKPKPAQPKLKKNSMILFSKLSNPSPI